MTGEVGLEYIGGINRYRALNADRLNSRNIGGMAGTIPDRTNNTAIRYLQWARYLEPVLDGNLILILFSRIRLFNGFTLCGSVGHQIIFHTVGKRSVLRLFHFDGFHVQQSTLVLHHQR